MKVRYVEADYTFNEAVAKEFQLGESVVAYFKIPDYYAVKCFKCGSWHTLDLHRANGSLKVNDGIVDISGGTGPHSLLCPTCGAHYFIYNGEIKL